VCVCVRAKREQKSIRHLLKKSEFVSRTLLVTICEPYPQTHTPQETTEKVNICMCARVGVQIVRVRVRACVRVCVL